MATNYPGAVDSFTNPLSGEPMNGPSHAGQHANANDAVEAIETELGANPSGSEATVAARLDKIEDGTRLGTIAATKIAGTALVASTVDAKGDLYVGTAADTVGRLAAGADGALIGYDSTTASGLTARLPAPMWVEQTQLTLDTITWPQIVAHRFGGKSTWGPSALRSADRSVAAGVKVLEFDFRLSSDGEAVIIHDDTLDRETNGTGNVASATGAAIAQLRLDVAGLTGGSGYLPARVCTPEHIIDRFAGRAVLFAEDKVGCAATLAPGWRAKGYADYVVIQSFSQDDCEDWVAEGFSAMLLSGAASTALDHAAVVAAGIEWVGYIWEPNTTVPAAGQAERVAAAKTAGLLVATYAHNTPISCQAAITAGADATMSDYPASALSRTAPAVTSAAFTDGVFPCETFPYPGQTVAVDTGLSLSGYGEAVPSCDMYEMGPLKGQFEITATFTCAAASIANGNNVWASIYLNTAAALYGATNVDAYHVLLRYNGTIQVYRYSSGVYTLIGTGSSAALSVGQDYSFRVTVTPTQIIVYRTDTATTVTVTDSTYRPAGGFFPSWALKQEAANTLKLLGIETSA